jgi:hypothetical protein
MALNPNIQATVPVNSGIFNPGGQGSSVGSFDSSGVMSPSNGMASPSVMPGYASGSGGAGSALQGLMGQLSGGAKGGSDAKSFVSQFADKPWVGNDPSYWEGVIAKNGGLTEDNKAYWATRMTDPPNVGSNSPNREGNNNPMLGMLAMKAAQPSGMLQAPGLQTSDPGAAGATPGVVQPQGMDSNLMALIAKLTGKG